MHACHWEDSTCPKLRPNAAKQIFNEEARHEIDTMSFHLHRKMVKWSMTLDGTLYFMKNHTLCGKRFDIMRKISGDNKYNMDSMLLTNKLMSA